MSRYIGPKCKLCRREGVKLFLKGEKCESPKCPVVVRQSAPGQRRRFSKKLSDFGLQLREKQKAKRIYGVSERQFKNYYSLSQKSRVKTGEELLSHLERRLDNVVFRLGWAASRSQARQRVLHGRLRVNGRVVNFSSYEVKLGDSLSCQAESVVEKSVPTWLSLDSKKKEATVTSLPQRDQILEDLNEQLIVEFYSR